MKPLAIVVLAAGCSSRLGQNKHLVSIQGQALITKQCHELLLLNLPIYCVVGYQVEQVSAALKSLPKVNVLENKYWTEGLGISIACATKALQSQYENLIFILGDQWQLNATNVQEFIASHNFSEDIITVASNLPSNSINQGKILPSQVSPPVIFNQRYYHQLCLLAGDKGAKAIISAHFSRINAVHFPQAFVDLDTPEQLTALRALYSR
ncbi:nucleotidyltransferase family protein [Thalassotalea piscium]|uniref:Molybdenum cofactor cytidylyltransferase n=1 Tax=Thalassotalea piscium TaxID=1230533 RepID=A0A7X0NDV3_9GAMM|nr:nucleotidyltransferase family protein [Thalassotalea piscium]MBB6541595.1 molybdenum cofactor cytidylyltransferase [Thalassotalea piscium]